MSACSTIHVPTSNEKRPEIPVAHNNRRIFFNHVSLKNSEGQNHKTMCVLST